MGIFAWIMIGLIAGFLATRITGARGGLLRNLVFGLLGALIGGFLFRKIGIFPVPDFWGQLITATIGAVIFLFLWQVMRRA